MRFAVVLLVFQIAMSQAPDLSGTWKLDSARSRVTPAVGMVGLIRAGAPATLHITQPANGTLIVESQINESQSRIYKPGGKTSTPVVPSGSITMTSKWEGRTLVSEGNLESTSGTPATVKEVLALSADGATLTIEITLTGATEKTSSTLVYTKSPAVEPCQKWPTPCKTFP